ncbi:hypothetical protein SDC9_172689 [bioreactor metagenome]|uniref:Uncharacterized protein n=1 Tax=bioreactor metagenome TaxID=1076179 RepID=A0A645GH26_9ZZZZ
MEFHISSAFKFFVNDVIQTGAGINQGGGDNGERAAFFQVARGAEKTFRRIERGWVHTARQGPSRWVDDQVISPRQPG